MNTIASRMKEAMRIRDIKQSDLVRLTGIGKSSISTYLTGAYEPKQRNIYKIAQALRVSEAWLMGYDVPMESARADAASVYDADNIVPLPKTRKLPLVGAIACGEPILAAQNIEDYVSVPDDIDADFVLLCKGDSMVGARIFDGDRVYIRMQPDVEDGEIAAVLIGEEATLKRIYKIGANRIELRAENPAYKPLRFEGEELNSIRIMGKAICFISAVR